MLDLTPYLRCLRCAWQHCNQQAIVCKCRLDVCTTLHLQQTSDSDRDGKCIKHYWERDSFFFLGSRWKQLICSMQDVKMRSSIINLAGICWYWFIRHLRDPQCVKKGGIHLIFRESVRNWFQFCQFKWWSYWRMPEHCSHAHYYTLYILKY